MAIAISADSPARLFPFPLDRAAPAIIICPGGGYRHLAGDYEGADVARWLNTLGVAAFVLHYRVAPHCHPAPLHDAQRAIRYVRAHAGDFRVDPARVGILGFSAGGHVAASASTLAHLAPQDDLAPHRARPDIALLCYPVITFGEHRHDGSRRMLLGDAAGDDALARELSLENAVTSETPPTFLWHTADDPAVPVENATLYAAALRRHSVPFECHIFPRGRHGLGMAPGHPVSAWTSLAGAFLSQFNFR